jgi:hypothetical protein
MSDTAVIYSWIRPGLVWSLTNQLNRYVAPESGEAVRLVAEQLLALHCERSGRRPEPDIALRRRALFGWPTPVPPDPVRGSTLERLRTRLLIRPTACAAARMDGINPALTEMGWRRCITDLLDRGMADDRLQEELAFLKDARQRISTEQARDVVATIDPDILDEVLGHFHWSFEAYLDSWGSYDPTVDLHPLTEIVCPIEAIVDVQLDPEAGN